MIIPGLVSATFKTESPDFVLAALQKALTAKVHKPKPAAKQGWFERMMTGVKDKAKTS